MKIKFLASFIILITSLISVFSYHYHQPPHVKTWEDAKKIFKLEELNPGCPQSRPYKPGEKVVYKVLGYNKNMKEFIRFGHYQKNRHPYFDVMRSDLQVKEEAININRRLYRCVEDVVKLMRIEQKVKINCPPDYTKFRCSHQHNIPKVERRKCYTGVELNFEIELVDILDRRGLPQKLPKVHSTDMTKEEAFKFFKVEIVKEGDPTKPIKIGNFISYLYTGREYESKIVFDATLNRNKPTQEHYGGVVVNFMRCFKILFQYFNQGTKAKFFCHHRFGHYHGENQLLRPYEDAEYDVEILKVEESDYEIGHLSLKDKEHVFDILSLNTIKQGDGKTFIDIGDRIYINWNVYSKKTGKRLRLEGSEGGPSMLLFTDNSPHYKCLDLALRFMSIGQKVSGVCPYIFAYGELANHSVNYRENFTFNLELVTIIRQKQDL